jgi:hypothetical protein
MSRPDVMGIKFVDDVHVGIIQLLGRQDAELIVDCKQRDWDHESEGELESVVAGERNIVRHLKAPSWERANSRSVAPSAAGPGRDHREGEAASGRSLAHEPLVG